MMSGITAIYVKYYISSKRLFCGLNILPTNFAGYCYFPSTVTENKVEITLFPVPVPNPSHIPTSVCQKNVMGETDVTDGTSKT